jgi:hypothetical protein
MGLSVVEGGNLPVLGVSFGHWGYFIIKRLRSTRGVLEKKVSFDCKAAKGAGFGWQFKEQRADSKEKRERKKFGICHPLLADEYLLLYNRRCRRGRGRRWARNFNSCLRIR